MAAAAAVVVVTVVTVVIVVEVIATAAAAAAISGVSTALRLVGTCERLRHQRQFCCCYYCRCCCRSGTRLMLGGCSAAEAQTLILAVIACLDCKRCL